MSDQSKNGESQNGDGTNGESQNTEIYVAETEDVTEPEAKAPRTAKGAVVVGARILTGVVGVAVAGLAIVVATLVPFPTHSDAPVSRVVDPVAAAQERVCAGSVLRLGDDSGQAATSITNVGTPSVRYGETVGDATSAPLSATDSSTGTPPQLLTLPPGVATASALPLLSGSQSQVAASGDLVGFAAAECGEGTSDSWLVAGATDTGRTTLLTLSNPSSVIATVTLRIYSETGLITAAGTDGIVVNPGAQRVLSLAGFAPDVTSPVVNVQSRGGQVVANLQESVVRTLEPGGVDIAGTSADPSTLTVIPGVVLANGTAVAAREPEPGFTDLRPVLRILVPGKEQARAEVTIVPDSGSAKVAPVLVTVKPGVVTELPLDQYPDGSYTVTIATDKPIVAAARVSTVGSKGASDLAWVASAAPLSDRALVTVAAGPSPVIHLANPTKSDEKVTILRNGKSTETVTVPAGHTVVRPGTAGITYTLRDFDRLAVAVSYSGDGQLATFRVTPSAPASSPITIWP